MSKRLTVETPIRSRSSTVAAALSSSNVLSNSVQQQQHHNDRITPAIIISDDEDGCVHNNLDDDSNDDGDDYDIDQFDDKTQQQQQRLIQNNNNNRKMNNKMKTNKRNKKMNHTISWKKQRLLLQRIQMILLKYFNMIPKYYRIKIFILFSSFKILFGIFVLISYYYNNKNSKPQKNLNNNNNNMTSTTIITNNNKNQNNQKNNINILSLLPSGFDTIYQRALEQSQVCMNRIEKQQNEQQQLSFQGFDKRNELPFLNDTVASLPSFGIIDTIEEYFGNNNNNNINNNNYPTCTLPPLNECYETQLTVIFMAYNPDRLDITIKQMKKMLSPNEFQYIIYEIILVWNGPRYINETISGQSLLQYVSSLESIDSTTGTTNSKIRIVYPLLAPYNLPNDLMNRYHPNVVHSIKTKGILYYDDDGPFYSYGAILSGFELWKRHSSQQMGAMSRELKRNSIYQIEYYNQMTNNGINHRDDFFISHCTYQSNTNINNLDSYNDIVEYNYRYFANYDANMVLPSGSILHVNYLCYIWHPIFESIRQFVLNHPVHPDDMTVSMIVSQLSGYSPRVYSRRIGPKSTSIHNNNNKQKVSSKQQKQRQLRYNNRRSRRLTYSQQQNYNSNGTFINQNATDRFNNNNDDDNDDNNELYHDGIIPLSELHRQRQLLFNINWDAGSGMSDMKQYWADLRTEAVNSLVRYFGSINSGSIGWCENTTYYSITNKEGKCNPNMSPYDQISWMKSDVTPKDTCP